MSPTIEERVDSLEKRIEAIERIGGTKYPGDHSDYMTSHGSCHQALADYASRHDRQIKSHDG